MTDPSASPASTLGIELGSTVRLIGVPPALQAALDPVPPGVIMTGLASETANVGIIFAGDSNDLRERLFTELDGLLGAHHVWITATTSGPDENAIRAEAELVSWHTVNTVVISDQWTGVEIRKS